MTWKDHCQAYDYYLDYSIVYIIECRDPFDAAIQLSALGLICISKLLCRVCDQSLTLTWKDHCQAYNY